MGEIPFAEPSKRTFEKWLPETQTYIKFHCIKHFNQKSIKPPKYTGFDLDQMIKHESTKLRFEKPLFQYI